MRTRALVGLTALVVAGTVVGCGTLYNHEIGPCPKSCPDSFRVYGGVRKDVEQVLSLFAGGNGGAGQLALLPVAGVLLAVDLSLRLVADTMPLPVTVKTSLARPREVHERPHEAQPDFNESLHRAEP